MLRKEKKKKYLILKNIQMTNTKQKNENKFKY